MVKRADIRKILFITLSNLGDIILTTPVLERLVSEYPGARIDVITGAPGIDIFSKHPAVAGVSVHSRKMSLADRLKQVAGLRKEHYDVVVDLKNSLLPYAVGAKKRTSLFSGKRSPDVHKRDEHLLKLADLGIKDPLERPRFFLPVSPEDGSYVEDLLGREWTRIVIVNAGAKSHLKRWDPGKFAALSDLLVSELKCRIVLTGADEDAEVTGKVASSVTTPIKDLCSKTTLGGLAALMARADLVITNDSAPLHVASAMNTPTLAIFGPTDEKKYGPLAERHKVVKPATPCRPCEKALCDKGRDEGCISDIGVDTVYAMAKQMLAGNV